jgi:hypothetical protein
MAEAGFDLRALYDWEFVRRRRRLTIVVLAFIAALSAPLLWVLFARSIIPTLLTGSPVGNLENVFLTLAVDLFVLILLVWAALFVSAMPATSLRVTEHELVFAYDSGKVVRLGWAKPSFKLVLQSGTERVLIKKPLTEQSELSFDALEEVIRRAKTQGLQVVRTVARCASPGTEWIRIYRQAAPAGTTT